MFKNIMKGIKTFFQPTPLITSGKASTAVSTVSQNFIGIGTVLAEGKVSEEHAEFALTKLYEAKLAVESAIQYGWNNGQGYNGG